MKHYIVKGSNWHQKITLEKDELDYLEAATLAVSDIFNSSNGFLLTDDGEEPKLGVVMTVCEEQYFNTDLEEKHERFMASEVVLANAGLHDLVKQLQAR